MNNDFDDSSMIAILFISFIIIGVFNIFSISSNVKDIKRDIEIIKETHCYTSITNNE